MIYSKFCFTFFIIALLCVVIYMTIFLSNDYLITFDETFQTKLTGKKLSPLVSENHFLLLKIL